RVLLVEAGPDMPEGRIPEALLDSYPGAAYIDKSYTWNALRITTDPWSGDDPGSARRWSGTDVLPYFRKLERHLDFDGPLHGRDGPIPICRVPKDHWNGFSRAAAAGFAASGFNYLPDQNGPFVDGYFPLAMSNIDDRRVSTATA